MRRSPRPRFRDLVEQLAAGVALLGQLPERVVTLGDERSVTVAPFSYPGGGADRPEPGFGTPSSRHSALDARDVGLADGRAG
jgi:hypothetical protein